MVKTLSRGLSFTLTLITSFLTPTVSLLYSFRSSTTAPLCSAVCPLLAPSHLCRAFAAVPPCVCYASCALVLHRALASPALCDPWY